VNIHYLRDLPMKIKHDRYFILAAAMFFYALLPWTPCFAFEAQDGAFGISQKRPVPEERKFFTREDLARMKTGVHDSPLRMLSEDERAFLDASSRADVDGVRKALAAGVNINAKEIGGDSALMYAVRADNLEIVRELLMRGAWPNGKSVNGFPPLAIAARRGHVPIARELLRAGARTEVRTDSGETALTLAILFGHTGVARELVIHGADLTFPSIGKFVHEGQPPLVMAASMERDDILRILLDHGANPNVFDRDRQTPLQWSLLRGNRAAAELLLAKGSDPGLLPISLCLFDFEPKLSPCR